MEMAPHALSDNCREKVELFETGFLSEMYFSL